jgi:hypothetical protein
MLVIFQIITTYAHMLAKSVIFNSLTPPTTLHWVSSVYGPSFGWLKVSPFLVLDQLVDAASAPHLTMYKGLPKNTSIRTALYLHWAIYGKGGNTCGTFYLFLKKCPLRMPGRGSDPCIPCDALHCRPRAIRESLCRTDPI